MFSHKIIIWLLSLVLLISEGPTRAIVHPKCLYEPQFNQKYQENLRHHSLRRLFREGKLLGQGNFGSVHQIQWLESNILLNLAVKQCHIHTDDDEVTLRRELDLLFRLASNPNTVRIYGCVESRLFAGGNNPTSQRIVYIITEKLGEDLDDKRGRNSLVSTFRRKFSNERRLQVLLSIAKAVQSLHRLNLVHSDLKPGNILSTDTQLSDVKLVDFGLSNEAGTHINGATDLFAAPEYADNTVRHLDPSFDIYSFGVTVGALEGPARNIERKIGHVWDANQHEYRHELVRQVVLQHMFFAYRDKPKLPNGDHIISVIQDCLSLDPRDRPTADEVVERIEAILQDKRVYYIHPAVFNVAEPSTDPIIQKKIAQIFREEPEEFQAETKASFVLKKTPPLLRLRQPDDAHALAEHPRMYKESPMAPTLNTAFGLQPEVSPKNQLESSQISIHNGQDSEHSGHPGEERRFWQSEVGPEEASGMSAVAIFFIVAGVLVLVGAAILLSH